MSFSKKKWSCLSAGLNIYTIKKPIHTHDLNTCDTVISTKAGLISIAVTGATVRLQEMYTEVKKKNL